MGNRSNINVVGNTTQGQNLGAGDACVFKGKAGGNLLQFRSISATGTSIQIFQTDNEILISGATGGGSGTITGAVNGLGVTGSNVCLGGTLTTGTTINANNYNFCLWNANNIMISSTAVGQPVTIRGYNTYLCGSNAGHICTPQFSLVFSTQGYVCDSSGTPRGLRYGGNYRANFACDSLVDAAYVTGQTGGGGFTIATNGLTGAGSTVCFGGSLTQDTNIRLGGNDLKFTGGTDVNGLCVNSGNTTSCHANGVDSETRITNTAGNIQLRACKTGTNCLTYTDYSSSGAYITTCDGSTQCGSIWTQMGCACVAGTACVVVTSPSIKLTTTPSGSGGYLCWDSVTKEIKQTTGGGGTSIGWSNLVGGSTVVGCDTIASGSTALCNTYYGVSAGKNTSTANSNVAVGTCALSATTTTSQNTAIGFDALAKSTVGCNTALGYCALGNNTTGGNNIAIGVCAGKCITTGTENIAIGSAAMGCFNIQSLSSVNIAIGYRAMHWAAGVAVCDNIAMGRSALINITGNNNVALGCSTMSQTGAGSCNVGIGSLALRYLSSGCGNIALGACALFGCNAGAYNTGCHNIGIGHCSTYWNSTGCGNVAVGRETLKCNTTGQNNVAIGSFALYTGNTTGSGNVAIGNRAGYTSSNLSNKLYIANTDACNLIYGEFDTKMVRVCGCMCITALPARTTETCVVYVDGSGKLSCGPASTGGTGGCCIGWSCVSTESTSVGCNAMPDTITGLYNSAFGNYALTSNTTGSNNTAIGWGALYSNTCGIENIALGALTMENNTSGCSNIAIGTFALCSNTNGDCNIAIGRDALAFNTTANENIAIGREAIRGANTVIGNSNIGIGTCALRSNCDGCENIAIGCGALQSNIDGFDNVAVGARALYAATGAWDNTAIGWRALQFTTIGGANTAVGTSALGANISGDTNTAVGLGALSQNTKGCCNVAIGGSALASNIGGHFNVAVGQNAALEVCGCCNIAIGIDALYSTNGAGCNNIAIGTKALSGGTTGCDNIAIGNQALRTTTTQYGNIAIGCCALYANTSHYNIAIGDGALMKRTTAASTEGDLVAIGRAALQQITTGRRSVAVGALALQWSTGDENTAVGYSTMNGNTTGNYNTAIGAYALCENCGSGNVAIGDGAFKGTGNTTFSGSIAIGCGAGQGYNISNTLIIANNNASFLVRGCFSNNTICNAADSASWNTSSDIRIKENVVTILCATDTLSQLNPVLFDYTENYSKQRSWDECKRICNYGFVAQEFEQIFPKHVTKGVGTINGMSVDDFRTMDTGHLVPLLVKAIQEQQLEINELKNKLSRFNI